MKRRHVIDELDPAWVSSAAAHSETFRHVLRQLARGASMKTLRMILRFLAEVVDAERVFFYRMRACGGFKVVAACNRDGETLESPASRLSHYAVQLAASEQAPVVMTDAASDRRYRSEETLEGKRPAQSIVVVPMLDEGETFGGFYADHRFRGMQPDLRREDLHDWLALSELALRLRAKKSLRRVSKSPSPESPTSSRPRVALPCRHESVPEPVLEDFHGFRSANPDLRDSFELLARTSSSRLPVLIVGETGTGKSLLARSVHASSIRSAAPFVTLHCGACAESLVESELLGHKRGAFTGAESDHDGLLVAADSGTLFLDMIDEAGPRVQAKLLRVLEEGEVRPLGAKHSIPVDVRLVSAACSRLEALASSGEYRSDLVFRLNTVVIEIPPLRERREDVLPLGAFFLARGAEAERCEVPKLTDEAAVRLVEYSWPGNVRELEHEMQRLVALRLEKVRASDLSVDDAQGWSTQAGDKRRELSLEETVNRAEKRAVADALVRFKGNRSRAARYLAITRKALYRRLKKYDLGE